LYLLQSHRHGGYATIGVASAGAATAFCNLPQELDLQIVVGDGVVVLSEPNSSLRN
jgi:hypothetical protein